MFKYYIQKILDILLPQRCLSCGKFSELICDDCLYRLPKESNVYGITTLFSYSDPVIKRALWLLKYKGVRAIVRPLAKVVHERLIEDLSSIMQLSLALSEAPPHSVAKIVLIPVPLSKEREQERGFNQSTLLVEELVRIDCQSFKLHTDVLKKIKNTPSQVSIKNKSERIKNLRGAFALENKEVIKDKIVILLDDITTTGTTLNECAKVLRPAKPRHIIKVALAH
ncbi:MAG: phosphoribosyltransferase family protein [bacterium]|nr:phosphoribosyltransferase family protein [bacterium]